MTATTKLKDILKSNGMLTGPMGRAPFGAWMSELVHLVETQVVSSPYDQVIYGLVWAYETGRLPGTQHIKLRKMTPRELTKLIEKAAKTVKTQSEMPKWLIKELADPEERMGAVRSVVAQYVLAAKALDFSEGAHNTRIQGARVQYTVRHTGVVNIDIVQTPVARRGQGVGRKALQEFLAATDAAGKSVSLLASPLDAQTDLSKLVHFYQSLGFVLTGKTGNKAGDPEMLRKPK